MDKRYDHRQFEEKVYKLWEKKGDFSPTSNPKAKPYTILMPPPNANASLHAGHAMYTVEDILIRWKRMQGFATEWIPGMDHAGFETQFVYEKELAKQGKSRFDFDRQTLYQNVFDFVQKNSGLIYEQFKRLGFSADWKRSVFTLDEAVVNFVYNTFEKMEREKLIYRDDYIVNYCTHCGTSLAELEVNHVTRTEPLFYLKYGPFTLATVRPETKFGDTAVAVNPKDKRYKKWVGKEIEVEGLLGKFTMRVIADSYVDPKFGTGVVKITPAHDPNDFQVWLRHKSDIPGPKQVIDFRGRLTGWAGKYKGLKVRAAREAVVHDLKDKGLLEKIDTDYEHAVAVCYRCKHDLEPMIVPNWFIKVNDLKKPVTEAVKKNQVRFFPPPYKKHMLAWLDIMHDWPISRQIAWGIRIPAWYSVEDNPEIEVAFLDADKKVVGGKVGKLLEEYQFDEMEQGLQTLTASKEAHYTITAHKPGKMYLQETDTFDTWFSSGQWPLVTLKESEFTSRYPTEVMGTLSDILKFWISRMMMFGLYLKNDVPFKDVYLWSMVADKKGVKMSKSKGNVINPIELVEKYGADALRMSLIYGTSAGSKVILSEEKVRGMRNFANKVWNLGRYVQSVFANSDAITFILPKGLRPEDKKILDELNSLIKTVTHSLEKYRFNFALEAIYEFTWHTLADRYVEETKIRSQNKDKVCLYTLRNTFLTILKLLHPFAPFVTETIWQELMVLRKYPDQLLLTSSWPDFLLKS